MVAGAIAGNISAEATTPTGNTFAEAMRGRLMEWAFVTQFFAQMTGQEGGPRQRIPDPFFREDRRHDHGPQYVRPAARPLAQRGLERLVGPKPALSPPCLRAQPS
jgi:hypothetical protein